MSDENSKEIRNVPDLPGDEKPTDWADRAADDMHYTRRRTIWPQVVAIWIAHFVFAFATGFILNFFGMFLSEVLAEVVTYIVCIPLFAAMVYVDAWRNGQQDYNLIKFGHIPDDKLRGLKAGLVAESVGLLLAILAMIHLFLIAGEAKAGIPEELRTGLHWGFLSAYHLFYFPFVGIVWPLEEISPFFCLVPIVIPVVVYHIGYTLGYKRISIRDKLVYVDPEKQKKQHERERKFK